MNAVPAPARLTVHADSKADLDLQLDKSIASLRETAMIHRDRGIMVTRHAPGKFTLELHPKVPFGLTLEMDAFIKTNSTAYEALPET
ncbi:hypothetical protein J2Y41_004251 [Arthrobacter sp. 1088]|uniref:hypothetical protein n=1 Tax=Arthrobacter sp. 1088 TaxID=2817768 RepID=UPI0028672A18|nr:hypothetical protein [Arthrobacter sp. 1088]MDR6688656.1 hypothetical protein [Arthrobacter sp. 1088]